MRSCGAALPRASHDAEYDRDQAGGLLDEQGRGQVPAVSGDLMLGFLKDVGLQAVVEFGDGFLAEFTLGVLRCQLDQRLFVYVRR
jgi:hypothetical protein